MIDQVHQLSVDALQPNPLQPRGVITPDSLMDLVESIKEHGVLEPLVVAETPAGYQIIAGERRWRAAKLAGLTTVPSLIRKTSPQGMLEMALVENVQRTDLNPVDRAKAFDRLINEFLFDLPPIATFVLVPLIAPKGTLTSFTTTPNPELVPTPPAPLFLTITEPELASAPAPTATLVTAPPLTLFEILPFTVLFSRTDLLDAIAADWELINVVCKPAVIMC